LIPQRYLSFHAAGLPAKLAFGADIGLMPLTRGNATTKTTPMIRNGLYLVVSKLLDGEEGGQTGVSVLRDGTMRGGGSIFYHVGSYVCSGGKWKGELTVREHTPALATDAWFARRAVSMGFDGTYTDDAAEFDATALAGKRSVQFKVIFRLLTPD
jgi:hypothetical protein